VQRNLQSGSTWVHNYVFDRDGRLTDDSGAQASNGYAFHLALGYGPTASAVTDSVYKTATVDGAVYGYWYDAFGRRRLKNYPTGRSDEFFHDFSNRLLTDQGNSSVIQPLTAIPIDDYVWLAGRPIALVRGQTDTSFVRLSDSTLDCKRNEDAALCGLYFVVTDNARKPVLMLDGSGRVTGVADYDPFGFPNRVSTFDTGAHPYGITPGDVQIADMPQVPGGPSVSVRARVLFQLIETESSGAVPVDFAYLKDADSGVQLGPNIGGGPRGRVWTDWQSTQAGHVQVWFHSDDRNCCPDGSGGLICQLDPVACPTYPNYPYVGAVLETYEYQRYQTGASPFWTPLRLAGHYYDPETELFENLNRNYDPSLGRYVQPEPIFSNPDLLRLAALNGYGIPPPYGFSRNNPLYFLDSTGDVAIAIPVAVAVGEALFWTGVIGAGVWCIGTHCIGDLDDLLGRKPAAPIVKHENQEDTAAPPDDNVCTPDKPVQDTSGQSKINDPDQDAVIQLAKELAKKGIPISSEEAKALLEWAKEYGVFPYHPEPEEGWESHPDRNFKDPHIHVGPVDHLPVKVR
jgi:RHS repeat-associated protein